VRIVWLANQTFGIRASHNAISANEGTPMPPAPQKVALVTGAARGIGLAVAKRFLADGWRVALLDIEGEMLWNSVAALNAPGSALGLHCDVSDAGAVRGAIAEIERRFGRLDALVNNAGIAVFAPLLDTSDDDWKRVLEVNLTGPFICTKAAAPLMREHGGGAIVNITSISAVRASTLRSAYGTSKAGLAHLTKQLAVELAALGIRVNAVAPGPVETAMAKAVHTPEIRADYHDAIPLNRYGLEEELAEAVSCAAIGRATSPARFSPSTAVSMPPASACRRCAASGGTGSCSAPPACEHPSTLSPVLNSSGGEGSALCRPPRSPTRTLPHVLQLPS
jgi:NAD(P)-dependent dehydrogenase (short-subunit alcohol dehydrogenase family)